jgi:hypothetical protein
MALCKKRGCKAYCIRDSLYCLFHTKKDLISKEPARLQRAKTQDSVIRDGLEFLFMTEEGRDLLGTEVRKQLIQKGMVVPITMGLQVISWNYPGYLHQRAYDKVARGLWWSWITWYKRFGFNPGLMPERTVFMAMVDDYIAARYARNPRWTRAMIGGSARLLSKAIVVVSIIDLLYTTGRISDAAFDTGIEQWLHQHRPANVEQGVQDVAKASFLEQLVRAGEYRV